MAGGVLWELLIVLLVVAVAVMAIVLTAVMRQVGGILVQLRPARLGAVEEGGPEEGSFLEVPDSLSLDRPTILVFVSPTCTICKPLLPALRVVERGYPEISLVSVVANGSDDERNAYAVEVGRTARPDLDALFDAWQIPGTPYVVAIDKDRRVLGSGVVNSLDQLENLADHVASPMESSDDAPQGIEQEVVGGEREPVKAILVTASRDGGRHHEH